MARPTVSDPRIQRNYTCWTISYRMISIIYRTLSQQIVYSVPIYNLNNGQQMLYGARAKWTLLTLLELNKPCLAGIQWSLIHVAQTVVCLLVFSSYTIGLKLQNLPYRHWGLVLLQRPDVIPCLSSNGSAAFKWKLRSHWRKVLLLRHIILIMNNPLFGSKYTFNPYVAGPTWTEDIWEHVTLS